MPESQKSGNFLKCFTISAIVLLVLVAAPYFVIEIARRDAERVAARYAAGARFELSNARFDPQDYVILQFRRTPDSPPNAYSADWSLSQWKVISTAGVYPSYDVPVEIDKSLLREGTMEGFPLANETHDPFNPSKREFGAAQWKTGQSQYDDVTPLKAERKNIDPGSP